jgi:hypothetical protein
MPTYTPLRFNVGQPQEEKPWPIWYFIIYLIILAAVWLWAKPIMDELVTGLVEPLSIAGYMDLFYNLLVWILFIGLVWIGISKTFRHRGG